MYDSLSADYDRFVNWQSRLALEMPFLEAQLHSISPNIQRPLRVLDAACGTGMHAIELARRGYIASGADISVEMVGRSRVNAAAAGVNVVFREAGFAELARVFATEISEGGFDSLFCLGNSLPHLLSAQALTDALVDFNTCLRPGGLVVIQNRNFDLVMTRHERWMEPQSSRDGEHEWIFQRFYDFQANDLIGFNMVTLQRSGDQDWQQKTAFSQLRPLKQLELTQALEGAGFKSVTCFGALANTPFNSQTSGNLVVTAIKTD